MDITEQDREATRANLMETQEQLELVRNGRDRLEEIQETLIEEFMTLFEQWKEEKTDLSVLFSTAQQKANMTRAMEGAVAVRSVAKARKDFVELMVDTKNIAGVTVPQFQASEASTRLDERGYGLLGTSARIDETADAYETLIDKITTLAELETAIKQILDELERIKRRINAFEYRIIPNLSDEEKQIERQLMERERQEQFQLKMIKDKKQEEEEEENEEQK